MDWYFQIPNLILAALMYTMLGRFLLGTAIHTAWEAPGTERVTVNTCTLDHPRALGLYQRMGFVPVRREERRRTLTRPIPEPPC